MEEAGDRFVVGDVAALGLAVVQLQTAGAGLVAEVPPQGAQVEGMDQVVQGDVAPRELGRIGPRRVQPLPPPAGLVVRRHHDLRVPQDGQHLVAEGGLQRLARPHPVQQVRQLRTQPVGRQRPRRRIVDPDHPRRIEEAVPGPRPRLHIRRRRPLPGEPAQGVDHQLAVSLAWLQQAGGREVVGLVVQQAVVAVAREEVGGHRCSQPFRVSRLSRNAPLGQLTGVISCSRSLWKKTMLFWVGWMAWRTSIRSALLSGSRP